MTTISYPPRSITEIDAEIRKLQKERHEAQPKIDKVTMKEIRFATKLIRYKTINGLTIHELRNAGFKTRVIHIRNCFIPGVPVAVPTPTNLRGSYEFLGKGGATHIVIQDKNDNSITTSSVCHEIDNFDYKMGVKIALDQFSPEQGAYMLTNGLLPLDLTSPAIIV